MKKKPLESNYILNNYDYDEAINYEKRNFFRIYYICLLSKENIINAFFFKSSLESRPLRLSIFIFNYSCDFALNTFFYLNQNISDKYHYEGNSLFFFTIVNNITITLVSTLFSYFLGKFLNLLTNSKDQILSLFGEEEKKMKANKEYKVDLIKRKEIYDNLVKIFKILKIKIILYIIINFLIMLFFLYFTTAFCEVYKCTQISWLYDSFISSIFSILLELIICLFISFIYICSIKLKKKCMYKIAIFLYEFD